MKNRNSHIKAFITSIFLVIVGGIIFNSTFFIHSHRTVCGKVIIHAHPFNKHAEKESPKSQHEHNKVDLQAISSLNYFLSCEVSYNIKSNFILEKEILNEPVFSLSSRHQLLTLGRDPPLAM
jgi:hypothetical protein